MQFNKRGHDDSSGDGEISPGELGPGAGLAMPRRRSAFVAFAVILFAIVGVTAWANYGSPSKNQKISVETELPAASVIDEISGEPAVFEFKPVAADEAVEMNAAIPVFDGKLTPAARFKGNWQSAQDQTRALDCLTAAIYYEAASETPQGQRAVAQVVINRLRDPAYPKSICGVVFQGSERVTGCQFSFTCDGSLARHPSAVLWQRLRSMAWAAMNGQIEPSVGGATHYHTVWVVPYWQSGLQKVATVGAHIFYTWLGGPTRMARHNSDRVIAEPPMAPVDIQPQAIPPLGQLPPMPAGSIPGFAGTTGTTQSASAARPEADNGLAATIGALQSSATQDAPSPAPARESPIIADQGRGELKADAQKGAIIP